MHLQRKRHGYRHWIRIAILSFAALAFLLIAGVVLYARHVEVSARSLITSASKISSRADAERELTIWRQQFPRYYEESQSPNGIDRSFKFEVRSGLLSTLHLVPSTGLLVQVTTTVQLFPAESRTTAYVTLGQISLMMRSFISGNFIVGVFLGLCSLAVFGFLKLPYFYFLGFISGFLSLVPYLGVILALFPPLTAGLGSLNTTKMLVIVLTVLGLHLLAMNVLYPKVIGRRLQLNPLVVTIGLLIWGFIWGAMGLVLTVPILGAIKIICDHVPNLRPIGEWMGE